ncbi:multicopper oxidase domain-containing protein, partial [Luteococcus peritonei]
MTNAFGMPQAAASIPGGSEGRPDRDRPAERVDITVDFASHTMLVVLSGTPGGVMEITGTMWGDPGTENPGVGAVEDWEIYTIVQNAPVPHPIHIHETTFEVVERRMIDYDVEARVMTRGPKVLLSPSRTGRKDTAFVYPGAMMRVRMRFSTPRQYMWHCHLLEHEDDEMMCPFRVGPWQAGQPADMRLFGLEVGRVVVARCGEGPGSSAGSAATKLAVPR